MKRIFFTVLSAMMCFSLTACGGGTSIDNPANSENNTNGVSSEEKTAASADSTSPQSTDESKNSSEDSDSLTSSTPDSIADKPVSDDENSASGSKILVAYFSLANEQYEVGVIEKGNTQIIAEMIAEKTGADLFSIASTTDYPTTYDGLLDISKKEENNHPELAQTVDNMADYDTVFIGYPIWWGDLPTIVKVFLENHDFSGKTVIPFCTHAGSGLSGTKSGIESLCDGAQVKDGLAVRGSTAQNDRDTAKSAVGDWLAEMGING